MDLIDFLSLLVAVAAFIYSLYVGKRQRRLDRQMLKLNEDQIRENARGENLRKQALIIAEAFYYGNRWAIEIKNTGLATARNIIFESPDIESDKDRIILRYNNEPYEILHSGDAFKIPMNLNSGHNNRPRVKLIWDDDLGLRREHEQILSLVF